MSDHILSREGKHTPVHLADRPPSKDQDCMCKKGSSRGWASPVLVCSTLSSEPRISSKRHSQISPSAATVGWIICVIDCKWPNGAFFCTVLDLSYVHHMTSSCFFPFSPAFFSSHGQTLSTTDYSCTFFFSFDDEKAKLCSETSDITDKK